LCFPDKNSEWKKSVLKECYINLGINIFELFYLPKIDKIASDKIIKVDNAELFEEGLNKNKGLILMSAHFSNWELFAYAFPYFAHYNLNIVAKEQASTGVNEYVMNLRKSSGNSIINLGLGIKETFSKIKEGEIVSFLIDQAAHSQYAEYIKLFGIEVPAFPGAVKIALRTGCELVFAYGIRKNFNYEIFVERISTLAYDGKKDSDVNALVQLVNKKLEEVIRKYPGQWLWFHKRFKDARF
jgi:KDO2-lipid IV(A) lauroyltransferase